MSEINSDTKYRKVQIKVYVSFPDVGQGIKGCMTIYVDGVYVVHKSIPNWIGWDERIKIARLVKALHKMKSCKRMWVYQTTYKYMYSTYMPVDDNGIVCMHLSHLD